MRKYQLPYGNGFQEVTLPEEKILYDIHGNQAAIQEDIAAATLAAVREPIASQTLQQVVQKGDKVAVIVSDVTRLVRTAEFLPVIIGEINAAGVPDEDITIVVATGTHRAHTHEEDIAVCGEEIVKRIKIHQHDSRNNEELTDFGVTSFGTPILIDSYVAEADKVIITGAASLHPMAADVRRSCRAFPVMLRSCITMLLRWRLRWATAVILFARQAYWRATLYTKIW